MGCQVGGDVQQTVGTGVLQRLILVYITIIPHSPPPSQFSYRERSFDIRRAEALGINYDWSKQVVLISLPLALSHILSDAFILANETHRGASLDESKDKLTREITLWPFPLLPRREHNPHIQHVPLQQSSCDRETRA